MIPTDILISRLHYPVDSLGYGTRAGIWFQGCTVHCRGCVSRDTWPVDESKRLAIGEVLEWVLELPSEVDGFTLSGGEPTDQPEAAAALLRGLLAHRDRAERKIDVLMYTGRSRAQAEELIPGLPELVDVLISEPYDRDRQTEAGLIGSANQVIHPYSELGKRRYADAAERYRPQRGRMGVHVDAESIWLVGVPRDGDMRRFGAGLAERGIDITKASWLT